MSTPMTFDISRTPATPFVRLVKVELRKAFDTIASFWLVMTIAVLVVLVAGFFLVVGLVNGTSDIDFTYITTAGAWMLQPVLAILAIMLVTSEWGQRTAMVTFALEARRTRVIYAKLVSALLLSVLMVLLLVVIAALCMLVLELRAPDYTHWNLSPTRFVGLLAFDLLATLSGYAIGTLLLNTPAAIVAFPVQSYVVSLVLGLVGAFWDGFKGFARYINFFSAQQHVLYGQLDSGARWAQLVVAALVWLLVPLVAGQIRVLRAEVK